MSLWRRMNNGDRELRSEFGMSLFARVIFGTVYSLMDILIRECGDGFVLSRRGVRTGQSTHPRGTFVSWSR